MSCVPRYKLLITRIGFPRFVSRTRLNSIDDVVLLHWALHFTNSNGVTINAQNKPDMPPAQKCCFVVSSPINFNAAPKLAKLTIQLGGTESKGGNTPRYNERGVNERSVNFTFTGCVSNIFRVFAKKKIRSN